MLHKGHEVDPAMPAEEFWEDFYRDRHWTGRVNAVLAEVVEGLPPGTALDLGCGEGADATWLARQGWRVTAVDISATALARATEDAAAAGVADRVTVARHDLAETFPEGRFDLVSAQYLHSPVALPRARVLRAAAQAVAPGGLLLVVDHAQIGPDRRDPMGYATPEQLLAALDLPTDWHPVRVETRPREVTRPDGVRVSVPDLVVAVRRS